MSKEMGQGGAGDDVRDDGPAERVDCDGVRVAYEVRGCGRPSGQGNDPTASGLPLVLVHGAGCHRGFWHELSEALADDRAVASVDLPGHGESSAPRGVEYTIDLHARAVAAVCDALGWSEAVFVGHSMGAAVLRQLLRRRRELVSGLGIVDGIFVRDDVAHGAAVTSWYDSPQYEERFAAFVETFFVAGTPEVTRELVRSAMLRCPRHVMLSQIASSYDPEIWQPVDTGSIPVSVLVGGATPLVADYEMRLDVEVADLTYRSLGSVGHFVMQERPEAVEEMARLLALGAEDARVEGAPTTRGPGSGNETGSG